MDRLWGFVAAILPALAALLVPMPAVDLAYQLRAGGEILAGEGIPSADTWTFTVVGQPWLDQQWGAQVLLALTFEAFGWTGLAVLRAILLALVFGLVFTATRRASGGAIPSAWVAILTLGSFVVAAPALALRPQLLAIALFAIVVVVLAGRVERPGRVWLIPLLAAAWANLHGSFPLVLVLVALAGLDDALHRRGPEAFQLAVVGVVAAAATLINPFGADVWAYVVNLASNPTIASQVSEWRAPSPVEPTGLLFYGSVVVVAGAAVGILAAWRRSGLLSSEPAHLVAPLVTLVAFAGLGMVTGRGLAWWALVVPVGLGGLVGAAFGRRPREDADASVVGPTWVPEALRPIPARDRPRRLNGLLVVALLLAFVALLPSWRPVGPLGVPENVLSHAPEQLAVELGELVERGVVRRGAAVWNPQLWGSWLELTVPELRVALDSRIELFSPRLWADAEVIGSGAGNWHVLLVHYRIFVVVVAPEQAGLRSALERAGGWSEAYRGTDGSIFLRTFGQRLPIG